MALIPAPEALDHLVFAVPDLDAGVDEIESLLGVRPSAGGSHPGVGTRNALLALGETSYLEIIAPDPGQPDPPQERPFGLDTHDTSRLAGWAVGCRDIEARAAASRERGYDPGEVRAMERRQPDGTLLQWRLTPLSRGDSPLVPFLIDWRRAAHPATRATQGCKLLSVWGEHPAPQSQFSVLDALGVELEIRQASTPALVATLEVARREIVLR